MPIQSTDTQAKKLAELTSQCVKCGLCLPHCPTFQLTGNEAASPRGRVTLSEHIIGAERLESRENEEIYSRIDDCLQCQACESACPSGVQVAEIISLTRAVMPLTPARKLTRRLTGILHSRPRRRLLAWLLRGLQRARLVPLLAPLLPRFYQRSLRHALPVPPASGLGHSGWFPRASDNNGKNGEMPQRPTVGILTGCTTELHDATYLPDLIALVQAAGFHAWVPPGQTCCGALAHHNGQDTQSLAKINHTAFAKPPENTQLKAVLVLNTGCIAHLTGAAADNTREDPPYQDAMAFLHQHRHALRFRPGTETVFVHRPCSQQHGLKSPECVVELLQAIPGVKVHSAETSCCGAAGSYYLTQPDLSDALASQWQQVITATQPDRVLSPNIGCSMQWHGLRSGIPVEHPLAFLARHLAQPVTP